MLVRYCLLISLLMMTVSQAEPMEQENTQVESQAQPVRRDLSSLNDPALSLEVIAQQSGVEDLPKDHVRDEDRGSSLSSSVRVRCFSLPPATPYLFISDCAHP